MVLGGRGGGSLGGQPGVPSRDAGLGCGPMVPAGDAWAAQGAAGGSTSWAAKGDQPWGCAPGDGSPFGKSKILPMG